MEYWWSYLALGIVQGLTEFLPVSSTGHLIVAREILGLSVSHSLAVDAVLHLATALAVAVYFRKDMVSLIRSCVSWVAGKGIEVTKRTMVLALILGTLPAVIIGLFAEDYLDTTFRSPELVAYALLAGSLLFFVAERMAQQTQHVTIGRGVVIGFFQALALIPGVSRSGATISGGLLLGLKREDAARFAFLLSFPVILGAGGLKLFELGGSGVLVASGGLIAIAALGAFVSGISAIYFLMRFLKTNTLDVFIVYRVLLAFAILFFL